MDQSLRMNNHHALGLHILVQTTPPENWGKTNGWNVKNDLEDHSPLAKGVICNASSRSFLGGCRLRHVGPSHPAGHATVARPVEVTWP